MDLRVESERGSPRDVATVMRLGVLHSVADMKQGSPLYVIRQSDPIVYAILEELYHDQSILFFISLHVSYLPTSIHEASHEECAWEA